MRGKEDLLLPAADMWTSGAEMLPVLLEELKSASLPEKQRRERSVKERKPENTLASSLPSQVPGSPPLHTTQQVAGFQRSWAPSLSLKAEERRRRHEDIGS